MWNNLCAVGQVRVPGAGSLSMCLLSTGPAVPPFAWQRCRLINRSSQFTNGSACGTRVCATFVPYPSSRPACPPPLQLRHRGAQSLGAVVAYAVTGPACQALTLIELNFLLVLLLALCFIILVLCIPEVLASLRAPLRRCSPLQWCEQGCTATPQSKPCQCPCDRLYKLCCFHRSIVCLRPSQTKLGLVNANSARLIHLPKERLAGLTSVAPVRVAGVPRTRQRHLRIKARLPCRKRGGVDRRAVRPQLGQAPLLSLFRCLSGRQRVQLHLADARGCRLRRSLSGVSSTKASAAGNRCGRTFSRSQSCAAEAIA